MVELGMAVALGKPTFPFRDDLRRATESEHYPLKLMLFTGMPEDGWEDWYYTSLAEIAAADKALARRAAEPSAPAHTVGDGVSSMCGKTSSPA